MRTTQTKTSKRISYISLKTLGVSLMALAILALSSASPASAHYVYRQNTVYDAGEDGNYKIEIRSEISHGSHNGGYYKTNIKVLRHTWTPSGGVWEEINPDAIDLSMQQQHIKLDSATSNNYRVCTATGWKSGLSARTTIVNHDREEPVCGSGYYETRTLFCFEHEDHFPGRVCYEHFSGRHQLPA